jgi:hypothetical protein
LGCGYVLGCVCWGIVCVWGLAVCVSVCWDVGVWVLGCSIVCWDVGVWVLGCMCECWGVAMCIGVWVSGCCSVLGCGFWGIAMCAGMLEYGCWGVAVCVGVWACVPDSMGTQSLPWAAHSFTATAGLASGQITPLRLMTCCWTFSMCPVAFTDKQCVAILFLCLTKGTTTCLGS